MMTMIKTTTMMMMTFWIRSLVVVYCGCKTVAHKKPQASNKKDPSCPIKLMTMKMMKMMMMTMKMMMMKKMMMMMQVTRVFNLSQPAREPG